MGGKDISFEQALAAYQSGHLDTARALCSAVLAMQPSHLDATHLCGAIALRQGRYDDALTALDGVVAKVPEFAVAHFNRGLALEGLRRFGAAAEAFARCIALDPRHVAAHRSRAGVFMKANDYRSASMACDGWIALSPNDPAALNDKGACLVELGEPGPGCTFFERAIAVDSTYAPAIFNLGSSLMTLGRPRDAVEKFDAVLSLQVGNSDAWNGKGNALRALRQDLPALEAYERAAELNPTCAAFHNNRANILAGLGRGDDAVAAYDRALSIDPDLIQALVNSGNVLRDARRHEEAIHRYDRALAIDPHHPYLLGRRLHTAMHIADWRNFGELSQEVMVRTASGERTCSPFATLALTDRPDLQLAAAKTWMAAHHKAAATPRDSRPRTAHDGKIKLGYYSANYHDHAVAHLIAGVIELHGRSGFEVVGYSFGPRTNDATQQRLRAAFDSFHDVLDIDDAGVRSHSHDGAIDIAVDLMGLTQDCRPGLFADGRGCAPIQVNYLGYPGTCGSHAYDYIIADKMLVTTATRPFFTENVVAMPGSYQANDSKRRIADVPPNRADWGLPATGVVYCSFNNTFKITPAVFDCWMKILHAVEGSVLWLFENHPAGTRNLKGEAKSRGIDPERLIFAAKAPHAQHLARQKCADLFLDTWPYNAHTTASDALWAGLPLLTLIGASFAGRVAASLLKSCGLDELIANSDEDFIARAVAFGQNSALLTDVKRRLAANRKSALLFDSMSYTRDLETAYRTMFEKFQRGEKPGDFAVPSGVPG